jgi:hypothetical protein
MSSAPAYPLAPAIAMRIFFICLTRCAPHKHKKREGLEPSLFLTVAPMFIALSTGTAFSHPFVRTFSVL